MTKPPPTLPSKSEINRCGSYLVDQLKDDFGDLDLDKFYRAYAVVGDFRSAHQSALGSVTMGLRSMVKSEGSIPPLVSQRLKRVPRIVRKLVRMKNSNLARLEDIGGCRAVLPDPDTMKRVRARIEHRWGENIVRRRDYVDTPNEGGYRAFHYVVQRHGRRIEVQLRTFGQQAWADAVEGADSRYKLTLKDGTGPTSMMEYFSLAGEMIYSSEYNKHMDPERVQAFDAARQRVVGEGYYQAGT